MGEGFVSGVRRRVWQHRGFIAGFVFAIVALYAGQLALNRTSFADHLVAPLLTRDSIGSADAIVVLGAGVVGDCFPNQNGVHRVLLAARLWRAGHAPVVYITGGAKTGCATAEAMARLAREIGVPANAVFTETASKDTHQNAIFTAPLLRQKGLTRLLLVTDRLHMARAAGVFARQGFDVRMASVPIYEGHKNNVDMLAAGIRESAALTYYKLRGWTGPAAPTVANAAASTGGAAPVPERLMTMQSTNPGGPVVVLGASYAGGWKLASIAGIPVVNKGVAGQQSGEMLERFERDVVAARPRAVIIWGFINDIFRSAPADNEAALGRVREHYTRMIERARAASIEPILATEVTVREPDSWSEWAASWVGALLGKESYQARINRHVIAGNQWLADLARRENLFVLDFQRTLGESNGSRRREFTADDGSHITEAGYAALTAYAEPLLRPHFAPGKGSQQ